MEFYVVECAYLDGSNGVMSVDITGRKEKKKIYTQKRLAVEWVLNEIGKDCCWGYYVVDEYNRSAEQLIASDEEVFLCNDRSDDKLVYKITECEFVNGEK